MMFDAHLHLQDVAFSGQVPAVIRRAIAANVRKLAVNATNEADWDMVAALADEFPTNVVPNFGVHPWWSAGVADGWIDRLKAILVKYPKANVGEIGLDKFKAKYVESPHHVSLNSHYQDTAVT
jgi:TatD DNase family protein